MYNNWYSYVYFKRYKINILARHIFQHAFMVTEQETRQEANTVVLFEVSDLPDVGNEPNQPHHCRSPKRSFGKKTAVYRSFQATWFNWWWWLHYDSSRDLAFCFTCVKAIIKTEVKWKHEGVFNSFHSWKEAIRCLNTKLQFTRKLWNCWWLFQKQLVMFGKMLSSSLVSC